MQIYENSILISDVHYDSEYRKQDFENFLQFIEENPPPQLIFFGDIFDLLFGNIEYLESKNQKIIQKLNFLGSKFEIIYLEGNHDFNLKYMFPNLKIIPISQQPFLMRFGKEKILISHGDYSVKGFFHFYRRFINKSKVLKILNFINKLINGKIIKTLEIQQKKKQKCYEILNFQDIIKSKLKDISCDTFIDGHYHQGSRFKINNINYINLFSFACNQIYFIVKSKHNSIFIKNISLKDF